MRIFTRFIRFSLVYLLALSSIVLQAQSSANYVFSTNATGSLEDMSSGTTTLLSGASIDDVASAVVNIGFDSYFMGNRYTQFSVNSNGAMGLGATATSTTGTGTGTTTTPRIAPFGGDQGVLTTGGKVHYKVIGSAPNRILVIEWLNMKINFSGYSTATVGDGTYQLQLSETTGALQFIYSNMTVATVFTTSPQVGFSTGTTAGLNMSIATATNAPTSNGTSIAGNTYALGAIANLNSTAQGTRRIYAFTPPAAAPAAPTWQSATAVTASGMTLNWTDNASNETGYIILRSTDNINFTQQGTTLAAGTQTLAITGLTPGTTYYWKVIAVREGTAAEATGTQATAAAATYYWVGATGGLWSTAANWNTAANNTGATRSVPATTDVLIVDGAGTTAGAATTISVDLVSFSIGQLKVTSNTACILQSSATTTRTITITGAPGDDFVIENGSSLTLNNATQAVALAFSGTGNTGDISGTLNLAGVSNALTTTGGTSTVVTVSGTGIINNSIASASTGLTGSAATFIFLDNSNYNVSGATTGAPNIPLATWGTNSTITITGLTTSTTAPTNAAQSFGNINFNCPTLTSSYPFMTTGTGIIKGNLSVTTGSGNFRLVSTGTGTVNGNVNVLAGNFVPFSGAGIVNVLGNTIISSGAFLNLATGAGTYSQRGTTFTNNGTIVGGTSTIASSLSFFSPTNTPQVFDGSGTLSVALNSISIQNGGGLTVSPTNMITTLRVNLFFGTIYNNNKITIGTGAALACAIQMGAAGLTTAGGFFDQAPIWNLGTGALALLYSQEGVGRTTGFEVPPTRTTTTMTVNNTNGLTIAGGNLDVVTTLTMTAGIINTSSGNILGLAGALSGTPSASNMVVGPFNRTFVASRTTVGTYGNTSLFPVGKGTTYYPIFIDPITTSGGTVTFRGEAFVGNAGTPGTGVNTLGANRFEAIPTVGVANLTSAYVRLTDAAILASNKILQAADAVAGTPYNSIVVATTGAVGLATTTAPLPVASYIGYFSYGDVTPCPFPTDQATSFVTSLKSTTSFTGSYTAATSMPNGYLVVRYAASATPTNPADFTSYAVNATLGTGTVVYSGSALTFNQTGLMQNTTYDYYVYSYNNGICAGPVYNTISPLMASVTTCNAVTSSPGTPTLSNLTVTSATASWTASASGGNYIVDVATNSGFTTFLSGYQNLNVGSALSINLSGLTPNTSYYVRVRADLSNCVSANTSTLTIFTGYCVPTGGTSYYLTNVVTTNGTTNINNATTTSTGGYGNYSATLSCSQYPSGTVNITLTPSSGTNYFYAWIDWNNDLDFLDAGETIFATTSYASNYAGVITVPAAQAIGSYRMRVANSFSGVITSCGPASNGEYEDYTFNVIPTPTCFIPRTITTSAITNNSATISWIVPLSGTPVAYEYEVRTSGAAGSGATGLAASGSVNSPIVTASVTGLLSNTLQSVYVRTFCGGSDYSVWSSATTFTTLCDAVNTFPFVETFDATSPSINCFTVSAGTGATIQWALTTADATYGVSTPAATTRFAYLYVFGASTTYNTYNMVTPSFALDATPKQFKYNYWFGTSGSTTPMVVQISVNGGAFTTIYSHTTSNSTFGTTSTSPWQLNTIDLTSYRNQTVQLKFVSTSNFGSGSCNQGLDQVTVEDIPTCSGTPSNGTISAGLSSSCGTTNSTTLTALAGSYSTGFLGLSYQWESSTDNFVSNITPLATSNPAVTVSTGVFTIGNNYYRLKTTCAASGISNYSNIVTIAYTNPSVASTTPASRCGTGTVTLGATANGSSANNWYAASTGGLSLGTGNTFTTPLISMTTTFYVDANDNFANYNVGKTTAPPAAGFNTSGAYLIFDALQTFTLNTVVVYPYATTNNTAGTLVVELQNSAGVAIATSPTFNVNGTTAAVPLTLNLGFTVPVGTNHRLVYKSSTGITGLLRETSGAAFPYTSPGVVSIKDGSVSGYYYYFYDWSLSTGCASSTRTAVVATVVPPSVHTITPNKTICNNEITSIDVDASTVSNYTTYTWSPATNLYTDAGATTPYTAGTNASQVYFKSSTAATVTITCNATDGVCNNVATSVLSVQPAAAALSSASTALCLSGTANILLTGGATTGIQWQNSVGGAAFTDISGAIGTSYTTPTLTASTDYQVILKNTAGTVCVTTTPLTIAVNNPSITSTTPASRCGTGTVTLSATANGTATLNWFAASTGGASLGTGNTFTTPSISTTKDYYVSAVTGGSSTTVGAVSPTAQGGTIATQNVNWDINFTVLQNTTLQSIDIYPMASGETGVIKILSGSGSGGTTLSTINFTTNVSGGSTPQTINIGYALTPGSYALYPTLPTSGVRRNITGAVYPYTSSAANITSNGYDPTYFMGAYKWVFSSGCESARTAVTATVNSAPSITPSATPTVVCAGSPTTLSATSTNPDYTYAWSSGATSVSPTSTTTYNVTATDASGGAYNGCTTVGSVSVTVNPIPAALTATASASPVCAGASVNLSSSSTSSNTLLTQDFEGATFPPTGWTLINNGLGNNWISTSATNHTTASTKSMRYSFNFTNAADAWAMTQGFALTAGKTYTLSFWYGSSYVPGSTIYTEKIKVTVGSNATVAGQTTTLYNNTSIVSPTPWAQVTVTYTPSTSGTYYFGFNCFSAANQGYVEIDDIVLKEPLTLAYNWDSAPAAFTSALQNPTGATPATTTTYTVTATNTATGCTASKAVVVSVNPLPTLAPTSASTLGCISNVSSILTANAEGGNSSAISNYTWTTSNGTFSSGTSSATATATAVATYAISVTDANGCKNNANVAVTGSSPVPLALSSTINTITANYDCDDAGWTYYGDASNSYFAINWAPDGTLSTLNAAAKAAASVQVSLEAAAPTCTKNGSTVYVMPRYWNVATSAYDEPVNVRFYYNPAEKTAVETSAGAGSAFIWFKTATSGTPYSPGANVTGQTSGIIGSEELTGTIAIQNSVTYVQFDNIDHFSGGTGAAVDATVVSPLPITLKSFTASEKGNVNVVNWETAIEQNVRNFVIEKSINGLSWSTLGQTIPTASKRYSMIDANPAATTYYRLKNVDKDGRFDYSNIVVVERKTGKFSFTSVAPNPTSYDLNVKFETTENADIKLSMMDVLGQVVLTQNVEAQKGINSVTVNTSSLPAGAYFLNLNNGVNTLTQRIVKQ